MIGKGGVISVQLLNETANVLRRKAKFEWSEIEEFLLGLTAKFHIVPVTLEVHVRGLTYAARHGLSIYDAMIVAAPATGKDPGYSPREERVEFREDDAGVAKPRLRKKRQSDSTSAVALIVGGLPGAHPTLRLPGIWRALRATNIRDIYRQPTAVSGGCTTLFSEDLHHGLIIDGLTIQKPLSAT